jgi:hypothetical protein
MAVATTFAGMQWLTMACIGPSMASINSVVLPLRSMCNKFHAVSLFTQCCAATDGAALAMTGIFSLCGARPLANASPDAQHIDEFGVSNKDAQSAAQSAKRNGRQSHQPILKRM